MAQGENQQLLPGSMKFDDDSFNSISKEQPGENWNQGRFENKAATFEELNKNKRNGMSTLKQI